jgi:hypothetical protein
MDEMNEKKIEEALFNGTDEASELKDMVWRNIEESLNFKEEKIVTMNRYKKKKSNKLKYGGIAAALLAVVLFTNMDQVNAAVDKIRDLFVPNKTIEQPIEGTKEKQRLSLR